jgi:hypothetical protein
MSTAHTTLTLRIEDDREIGREWTGSLGDETIMAALHQLHFPIAMGRIEGLGRKYSLGFMSRLSDGSGPLVSTSTIWSDEVAAEMTSILDAAFGRHEVILPMDLSEEMAAIEDEVLDELGDEAGA